VGYLYIAGEVFVFSDCFKFLLDGFSFEKKRIDEIGYWIEGQARV
jgi:NADPH-dependent ferric siderophore reductase